MTAHWFRNIDKKAFKTMTNYLWNCLFSNYWKNQKNNGVLLRDPARGDAWWLSFKTDKCSVPSRLTISGEGFSSRYHRAALALMVSVTQAVTAACDKALENHLYRIRVCRQGGRWAEGWEMHRRGQRPPAGPHQRARGQGAHPA